MSNGISIFNLREKTQNKVRFMNKPRLQFLKAQKADRKSVSFQKRAIAIQKNSKLEDSYLRCMWVTYEMTWMSQWPSNLCTKFDYFVAESDPSDGFNLNVCQR